MLRIGDFAQLTRISTKTLRHYDRLGLLKPNKVDNFTGYRYYSATQLPRLNRILVFKELGFSLEEISRLLAENIALEEIQGMLRLKQLEIKQRLEQDRYRLSRLETRLQELKQEKAMPNYEVLLKPVEAQLVAATVGVIPNYQDCQPIFANLFDRVYHHAYSQGLKKVGCGISIYHDTKLRDRDIPVEVAAPIFEEVPDKEQVWTYKLPGVETMACVVHHGSFSSLGQAYNALLEWIEKNGYQIVGSNREVYLQYERDGDPNQYVTEVQVPVEKT
ncbi:Transcriptional regulator [Hyella patelloides LEGE 07179]|uniref:Transcriptional regulator n=1 Tax=Hyella patelloides LEGE 07179 TaxID=945734 RepID=A0A563W3P9_9CYAN|nr:MerR family transcriptional regulator [Hyella patelloides]VEP18183.1 Transcriptional regulator [Hyella patelloides LEGE 07179]